MSHLVVAIFAVSAGVVIWLVLRPVAQLHARRPRSAPSACCSPRSGSLPLAANLGNTTDMRYEPIGIASASRTTSTGCSSRENWFLYPARARRARRRDLVPPPRDARSSPRSRSPPASSFCDWEGLRDILGKAPAWNLRLLPFWYLMLYLLAALGAAELARLDRPLGVAWVVSGDRPTAGAPRPRTLDARRAVPEPRRRSSTPPDRRAAATHRSSAMPSSRDPRAS